MSNMTRHNMANGHWKKQAVLILLSAVGLAVRAATAEPGIVPIESRAINRLVVGTRGGYPAGATVNGNIKVVGKEWAENWTRLDDHFAWKVKAERADDYELALVYKCKKGSSGSTFEITAGDAKVTGKVRETKSPYFANSWELVELDGELHLPAGTSTMTLRATSKPATADVVMDLFSLELTPLSAKQFIEDEKNRSKKTRANTNWFVAAKYGIMVHWIQGAAPPQGPKKPYADAVNDFNVDAFAKMINETGAGYVIFHVAGSKMPAPLKEWEKVHGQDSTTKRDLIADLSDALAEYKIELILGQGLPEVGLFWRVGHEEHVKRFIRIYTEIGLRYGKKLAGTYFDGGRELATFNVDWEGMFRACKAGNPDRLLCYNFWVFPLTTAWADFYCGEGGFPHIRFKGRYVESGAGKGLQAHVMFPIDDDHRWWFKDLNHKIGRPVYFTKQLIEWVRDSEKKGAVPTFNMAIYQDGTVSSATLEQMKAVRRAIREEREEDDKPVVKKAVKQKEPGLIGWWKFDEGSGDTAGDSSGYGNDGITGARWINGVLGKALDFQGIECVQVPPEVFVSVTNEISITFWQYGNPHTQPMENSVFEAYTVSDERVLNCHLPWPHESGTLIILEMAPHNGFSKLATPDEYKGRWNHWAFTKNAETGQMCMYLNGKMWHSIGSQTGKIEGITKFAIGANANGALNYDGALDDFRIYNRELTTDEINKLYQDGASQGRPDAQVSFIAQDADRQLQLEPVLIQPEDITVLMADRSNLSGGPKYNKLDPGKPFKRFWVDNWKSPDASIEWNITAPKAGEYEAAMLIEGAPGVEVEITGPDNTLTCELVRSGWDKVIVPGQLSLPQGAGVITVRLLEAADVKLKSVELINLDAKKDIEQCIKKFRSSTKWLADAKYGLMFQWGEWGYPRHGDKKKWPKMIDDFDAESFADMVADTGAGYVIWSATWTTYYFPAPIKAIDDILPGRTSERDLIGELANALDKRGVRLIVYYHLGHDNNPNLDWWKKNWVSSDDKEIFFTNLCAITTEIGKRYGRKLAGWMLDDGMVIYPAPFEWLGKALKAGNPERIISYNSWIMPRFTEFQDFHFGEGNEQGAAGIGPKGGDGIAANGPQKGLQGHANFILDGPNWGIRSPETKINPPRWTKDQIAKMVKNAMEHKLALSFNLLMYEDGSVSPESLNAMQKVRQVVRSGAPLDVVHPEAPMLEMSSQEKDLIRSMVRAAGKISERNVELITETKIANPPSEQSEAVAQWLHRYGKTIQGTRGGPFESTDSYVTTYQDNIIYVHILDWKGKNNITLPAVIDREIQTARNFGDPRQGDYVFLGYIRQHPWGLLVVVPENERSDPHTIVVLEIEGNTSDLIQPRLIDVDPSQLIFLMGDAAKLEGGLDYQPGPDFIQGWSDLNQSATWKVRLSEPGYYELATTYACSAAADGPAFEIVTGKNKIAHTLVETKGWVGPSMNFEERLLDSKLHLAAGVNSITLHPVKKAGTGEMMKLYALKLISPLAKKMIASAKKKAGKHRPDTEWFVAAKYGVMFHWTPGTQPRRGAAKSFPEAVRDFDVTAFTDMVRETGAGYVMFTAPHGIQWFPGPIQSIEKILPGRTCRRDLMGDMADALDQLGIKLIQYYHHGVGDPEWSRASGFYREDKSQFFQNEIDILTEIGLRYGKKLAGFWFDDRYPQQPFEALYKATKTGNPDRLVAWNSWIMPISTEFQDYYAGEFGGALVLPDADYFGEDGPASGLQPHGMIYLDDPWMHGRPDSDIVPPLFETKELIEYVQKCIERKLPITMNMGCYQDGTVSSATLEQMKALRKAVKEN